MAMVAAWGEAGEAEHHISALLWLEQLLPPELVVSEVCSIREAFSTFVPVNDDADPTKTNNPPIGTYPLRRHRVERSYPTVIPSCANLYYKWPFDDVPAEHQESLSELCSLVTYLGHSATPVRMWIEEKLESDSTLTPILKSDDTRSATHQLRVFDKGRTNYLVARYNRVNIEAHSDLDSRLKSLTAGVKSSSGKSKTEAKKKLAMVQEEYGKQFPSGPPQTLRPQPARWQGYAPPQAKQEAETFDGPFDPGLFVFRQVGGRRFGLESCGLIADALRKLLMKRFGDNAPEWISGHAADESVSKAPRPAYLPLGFVDHDHADGHLLGLAVAVPNEFSRDNAVTLLDLLTGTRFGEEDGVPYLSLEIRNPHFGNEVIGTLELELEERPERSRQQTLQSRNWIGPARQWKTVTPIVLPQFPRRGLSIEDVVAKACLQSGYPEPVSIRASLDPQLGGVPHARSFHVKPRPGRPPRPLFHADIVFPVPVRGPVLIGAGRYAGYGICRPPMKQENA